MKKEEILAEFEAAEAILSGHFILSSGKRSPTYLQCARVLMDTSRAEKLVAALIDKVQQEIDVDAIDVVVAPAMGGVIVGYEVARQLNKPSIFCERPTGTFEFRRGFDLNKGDKVLVVEDVVTTGLSSRECFECIEAAGGRVVAECSLVDRSNGSVDLGVPYVSLLQLDVPVYDPNALPEALASIPAIKPGSRKEAAVG